jgi:Coenzyme PQQ synthesis protein D (PqqD)
VRYVPAPDLEVVVEQDVVYLVPLHGRLVRLNRRGSETWSRVSDEGGDLGAAATALAAAWGWELDEARQSVDRFVGRLAERGFLVEAAP